MKVSRTAAVLCAVAVASVSVSASASADVRTETEAGKNGRALRGGADHDKTAKKKPQETKKRALKAKDEASSDEATLTGTGGENRAFTTGATASTRYNNQAVASTYQQGSNAAYGNNKYGYLDRYAQYLTPEQLERLRNPGAAAAAAAGSDDEEDVGGTEQPAQARPVPTTAVASPARPVPTASSSYTQTAATEPQQPVPNTLYVSAPELNRMSEAGPGAGALNRNPLEAEAPIREYDESTGYGVVGSSNANANGANTNSNGGALNRQQPVPAVQTTAWKPITRKPITQDVWVEHHVPGVPTRPAWDTGDSAATWSNNANKPSNAGGTSAASANSAGSYVPNRNPSANAAASNRIPVADAPCDGTNTSKSPSPGIQHIFRNPWDRGTGWGSCADTRSDCPPGECCLGGSGFGGGAGACIPFSEICEPGETPGSGDCPYPWMTSDRCLCGGDDPLL